MRARQRREVAAKSKILRWVERLEAEGVQDPVPQYVSDGGLAAERMVRSLDWAYHQARRERCVRELAARLKDSTLQRILWGVFRGRDQAEAIRLADVSRATFFRGSQK